MPARREPQKVDWSAILADAINKPGVISEAYSRVWNYSFGNQLLAWFQCFERKITPGPIHTFLGWKNLGRTVRKGEKALTLCMPTTVKQNESSFIAPIGSYSRKPKALNTSRQSCRSGRSCGCSMVSALNVPLQSARR
jgi:hypothetical protein